MIITSLVLLVAHYNASRSFVRLLVAGLLGCFGCLDWLLGCLVCSRSRCSVYLNMDIHLRARFVCVCVFVVGKHTAPTDCVSAISRIPSYTKG